MPITNEGVLFSVEKFYTEPQTAQRFLEIMETQSHGIVPPHWREMTEDQIVFEASHRLHLLEQDLVTTEFLKKEGLIQ